MNLNTIVEVKRPKSFEDIEWRDGHAFLGGGTWLFSEPQVATDTLVDLEQLGWPPLTVTPDGLEIAATCRIVELHDFKGPPDWRAVPLFDKCIDAFLMSFKIWNAATVGGNVVHVAAGRRHDLAHRRARRRLHPVAARRQAARGAGRRLRHRHAHQRAAEGRAAALDPPAGLGADQALRHAPGVAHPLRPLGGADHRHRRRRRRATSC